MLSLILAALWALPASAGTSVEQFSPQGLARGVRQVVARFSAPMVPFGDPRGLIQPFEIDCAEKGASRWADGRNWVFDFDRDLPAGVSCRFRLKPGTRALDGSELDGRREFAFTTGGPAIARSNPYEGSRVAEDQLFILHLDGEATPESVLAHAAFWVEGLGEAVGVRLATGAAREQILRAARVDDSTTTLVLGARLNFPPDRKLSLVWGRGVAAPSGAATETDQALAFKVRPDFTASFTCERVNAREDCLPLSSLSVDFTAPIRAKDARHVTLEQIGAAATAGPRRNRLSKPEQDEEGLVHRVSFEGPFPAESEFRIHLPAGLQDDAGRPLANAMRFPLTVRTGGYPPLAKFPARFGILEAGAEPAIPLTIRSLEAATATRTLKVERNVAARLLHIGKTTDLSEILSWLDRVNRPEQSWDKDHPESDWRSSILDGQAEPKRLPRPRGEKAFEVIGIPVPQPGFYVAELESEALGSSLFGEPRKMYVPTAALVTDLSVHLKHGRQSSLVWVTSLAEGAPVQDARVAVTDCNGAVLWTGSTDAAGLARVPALLGRTTCPRRYLSEGFAAAAWKGGDFAFALERWDDGIEPWRFQLPTGSLYEDESRAHTVFDRTLLRAGEVVHMKHFLRRLDAKGFGLPDARPAELIIRHAGSEEADVKLPVAWSADGTAESAWPIPAQAKLGVYEVCFELPGKGELESGSFHVEEFRVPLMKATVAPPAEPLVAVSTVPLDLAVRYLSGGGADGMPVRLRTRLVRSSPPSFDRFEEYQFANGPVPPSSRHGEAEPEPPMRTLELNLGAGGTARASITGLELQEYPQTLEAELEFRDPNGETQTAAARAPVWPGERLVAVKADSWASSAEGLKLRVAVADLQGHAASGAPVRVDLFQRKTFSHRKRLVGGFYAYDHSEQIAPLGTACAGVTDEHGLFLCEAKSPVSGSIFAQAVTEDEKGRSSTAHTELWVAGKGEWWFEVSDNDRMDVLAENRRYEPGETAKLQVRMPFAQATALVTVEREGILDAFVEKLSRKNPVVRVPVRGDHAPNVFVSVLAVRGREGKPQPTALVDLARPAFRLGFAELRVGYAGHELKVRVSPEREVYHTRETARVKIEVRGPGGAKAAGAEAAVAAVDEGLLQLLPNDSWNLLDGLMGRRDLAVVTATAQMQVVGRRHFGLKALPAGGGGGRKTTRELFDTLLLWKGRVALGPDGTATVDVPLNDSLTSFRVVAVAHAGRGLFGTGGATIRSTQDLQLLAGLPPVVREGDRFAAMATVRNASDRRMDVEVAASTGGAALPGSDVQLGPGEARELAWPVEVPAGRDSLEFGFEAREKGGQASDRMKSVVRVKPAVPVVPLQATLSQVNGRLEFPVERPQGALADRGGVEVRLTATLSKGTAAMEAYMRDYPYICLEQKTSRAVALRDEKLWAGVTADLTSYLDSDGMAKYFPQMEHGSEVLTTYVLAVSSEAGLELPEGPRTRMLDALKGFVEGRVTRNAALPTADLALRKLAAVDALSRHGKFEGRLLDSIPLDPNLWPTSSVLDWYALLVREPSIQDRGRRLQEAEQILRSRLNFQGTTMGFSTEGSDCLWWLMVSGDVNAVKLVLAAVHSGRWEDADAGRLMTGALARQHRGHWDLTLANAWGRLALEKFSASYESVPVSGRSEAKLADATAYFGWNVAGPEGKAPEPPQPRLFPWPAGRAPLSVSHDGPGKPWAFVTSLAALPLKEPFSSGYKITKTWTPVQQKFPGRWSRGDVARVHLEVEAQADRTWVVVQDPVPAGSTILGRGLGGESAMATRGEKSEGWVWPAFEERAFDAFRAYYEYVPKGRWTVEYTVRLNNEGTFGLPPTRAEAMYAPEMFGEIPNAPVEVTP